MLRGVNRNVLVVRSDKDSNFEAVYFVIKHGAASERGDILKEAAKIISGLNVTKARPPRRYVIPLLIAGAFSGAFICSVFWIIFALL